MAAKREEVKEQVGSDDSSKLTLGELPPTRTQAVPEVVAGLTSLSISKKPSVFQNEGISKLARNLDKFLSLGFYFPTGTAQFAQDYFSKLIIQLKSTPEDWLASLKAINTKRNKPLSVEWWVTEKKKEKLQAIKSFAAMVSHVFNGSMDIMFITVPSSKQGNKLHGPTLLAKVIARGSKNWSCGNEFLTRTKSKTAAHSGGDRSKETQRTTLKVNKKRVQGRTIVLLDDIITTGNSIEAARELLLEAGAHNVICFTLGKTVNHLAEFSRGYIEAVAILRGVIINNPSASITLYDSHTKKPVSLTTRDILEFNFNLFIKSEYNSVLVSSSGSMLHSFSASVSKPLLIEEKVKSDIDKEDLSEIEDDDLIERIFDDAPDVTAAFIKEAQKRGLEDEICDVFRRLGKDDEDADYTSIQQDFAVNMREFGFDFLNIGPDEESDHDEHTDSEEEVENLSKLTSRLTV